VSSPSISRWIKFGQKNADDLCRIRYPDPAVKVNDTVKIDLNTGKITDFVKFDTGAIAIVTGGRNMGRVGVITHRERHDGGFNIVHIKDAVDNEFATREGNVFIIGKEKPWISLPKGKGVKVRLHSPQKPFHAQSTDMLTSSLSPKSVIADELLPLQDERKCRKESGIGSRRKEINDSICKCLVIRGNDSIVPSFNSKASKVVVRTGSKFEICDVSIVNDDGVMLT
jgi:hypothetical protein